MNKIDRLYKKALATVRTREMKDQFIGNLAEIGTWFSHCQQAFKDGKEPAPCDRAGYGALVQEYEEQFGSMYFSVRLQK